ncbi:hypothetical protein MOUN0_L00782 [Monosporozyma unispora]
MTFIKEFKPVALTDANLFKSIKVGNLTLSPHVTMAPCTSFRGSGAQNLFQIKIGRLNIMVNVLNTQVL